MFIKDCAVISNGRFEKRTGNFNGLPSYSYEPITIYSGNAKENKI